MELNRHRMTEEDERAFEMEMAKFAKACSDMPPGIIKAYIQKNQPLVEGKVDHILMTKHPIESIKITKQNKKLWIALGALILTARDEIRQYLIDTGQLKEGNQS